MERYARLLVEEYGVDADDGSHNPCGLTPLMEAAGRGHAAVAAYLLEEAGAAAVTTTSGPQPAGLSADRTQLLVDLGASALSLSLLSIRDGLVHSLATLSDHTVGGRLLQER